MTSLLRWFGSGWPSAVGLGCVTILLGIASNLWDRGNFKKAKRLAAESCAADYAIRCDQADSTLSVLSRNRDVLKRSYQIDLAVSSTAKLISYRCEAARKGKGATMTNS